MMLDVHALKDRLRRYANTAVERWCAHSEIGVSCPIT
jgi:hypothetical protein